MMGIAFVPVYIRVLGIEAYGLIGFFISLQVFFTVLDMGLSATLNRELARHRHAGDGADIQRDLVRTLEWVYLPVGLLIAVGVFILSETVASHWLNPVALSNERAAHAIALMGLSAGLQWPCAFYAGGFRGLERQVALNVINAIFATLRFGGAAAVLLFLSPSLEAFLWWQVGVSALQTLASGLILWRLLPKSVRMPAFNLDRLRDLRGFAVDLAALAALSFFLTQSDRILLSTLLPLTEFGYYTLAASVAAALSAVVQPFFTALYPRYSGLVASGNLQRLVDLYHPSNQMLAVVVASTASVMAFFAEDLLRIWTQDPIIASKSSPILSILVVGTGLNGLANLPYALQLAYGWTRLALIQNAVSALIVLPAIWWSARGYGAIGAAIVCVALNLSYVVIGVPLMHRRLLPHEMWRWYLQDILPPTLAAVGAAGFFRLTVPQISDGLSGAFSLGLVGLATLGCAALASPYARQYARLALARIPK